MRAVPAPEGTNFSSNDVERLSPRWSDIGPNPNLFLPAIINLHDVDTVRGSESKIFSNVMRGDVAEVVVPRTPRR